MTEAGHHYIDQAGFKLALTKYLRAHSSVLACWAHGHASLFCFLKCLHTINNLNITKNFSRARLNLHVSEEVKHGEAGLNVVLPTGSCVQTLVLL